AERAYRALPPNLKGEGPDPATMQLQGQVQTLQAVLGEMQTKLQKAESKAAHNDDEAGIRAYEAVTKRLDVILAKLGPPEPTAAEEMEREMTLATHQTGLDMLVAEHSAGLHAMTARPEGAQA